MTDFHEIAIGLNSSLPEIDRIIRERLDVDIVLIEAGAFYTAVESSADALAEALGYRVGIDGWGRRISGIPVVSFRRRQIDLDESGFGYVVVATVARRGSRAVREVVHVARRADGRPRFTISATLAASGSARALEHENEHDESRVEDVVAAILPRDDVSARLIAALEQAFLENGGVGSRDGHERRSSIFELRTEFLTDLWQRFLDDQDPVSLRRAAVGPEVDRLGDRAANGGARMRRLEYGPLSTIEESDILDMHFDGFGIRQIAHELERPTSLVRSYLMGCGHRSEVFSDWRPSEDSVLDALLDSTPDLRLLARRLSRSPWDVALHVARRGR